MSKSLFIKSECMNLALYKQYQSLFEILEKRFHTNFQRHSQLTWSDFLDKLLLSEQKIRIIDEMERTGGEPDVIGYDAINQVYIVCDCSPETPKGRRSLCYDRAALESRKDFPPQNTAVDMAAEIGAPLMTEEEYWQLQTLGPFDTKTSSWVHTPLELRQLGGALFAEYRYGRTFVFHNGAQSYYAVRGFRVIVRI